MSLLAFGAIAAAPLAAEPDETPVIPPAVVVPEIGGRIVGGHFSRGKWRDLKEELEHEERARQIAAQKALARKRKEQAERDARRDALIEARVSESQTRNAEQAALTKELETWLQQFAGQRSFPMQALLQNMQQSALMRAQEAARQKQMQDEEEEILLLM